MPRPAHEVTKMMKVTNVTGNVVTFVTSVTYVTSFAGRGKPLLQRRTLKFQLCN